MMTPTGPRGSVPALIMRSGLIRPVHPSNARQDVSAQHVMDMTDITSATALDVFVPGSDARPTLTPLVTSPPSALTTAVAQTMVAVAPKALPDAPSGAMPDGHSNRQHWHLVNRRQHPMLEEIRRLHPKAHLNGAEAELGEWQGRPVAKFEIAASPPAEGAQVAVNALRRAAQSLQVGGLHALPPELIGGPLAALIRGGAIQLHFQNGVVIRTAL